MDKKRNPILQPREISEKELLDAFITFCNDIGISGNSYDEIMQKLNLQDVIVKKQEDKDLIWFVQIVNEEIKYYSEPISKYEQPNDYHTACVPIDKERLPLPADTKTFYALVNMRVIDIPIFIYNKITRRNKIPPLEEMRRNKD